MADPAKVPTAPERKEGQNDPEFAKQTPSAPGESKPDSKKDLTRER